MNRYDELRKPTPVVEQDEDEARIIVIKDDKGRSLEGEIEFEFEIAGEEFVAYTIKEENYEILHIMKYDEAGNLTEPMEDEWPLIEQVVEAFENGDEEEDEE